MARGRWWAAAAGVVALSAVILGLTVATGCTAIASACVGPTVEVHDLQDASADPYEAPALTTVNPGDDVTLVGYGLASCDDTGGSAFCSSTGRVQGPRDLAIVWRQAGLADVPLADGRVQDGGTFAVDAVVPDGATAGPARVVVVREGEQELDTDVEVTADR